MTSQGHILPLLQKESLWKTTKDPFSTGVLCSRKCLPKPSWGLAVDSPVSKTGSGRNDKRILIVLIDHSGTVIH